jgi:hypothetical protein
VTRETGGTPSTLPVFVPRQPSERGDDDDDDDDDDDRQEECTTDPMQQVDTNQSNSYFLHEQEMWEQERAGMIDMGQDEEDDEPHYDFYRDIEEEGFTVVDKRTVSYDASLRDDGTAGSRWHPPRRESCEDALAGELIECLDSSDLYDENMTNYEFNDALVVKEDIRKVNDGIPLWKGEYRIVDRLGEGKCVDV